MWKNWGIQTFGKSTAKKSYGPSAKVRKSAGLQIDFCLGGAGTAAGNNFLTEAANLLGQRRGRLFHGLLLMEAVSDSELAAMPSLVE